MASLLAKLGPELSNVTIKGSSNHNVIANIEMKAELGLDGKNPNWKNAAYYIHITKDQ